MKSVVWKSKKFLVALIISFAFLCLLFLSIGIIQLNRIRAASLMRADQEEQSLSVQVAPDTIGDPSYRQDDKVVDERKHVPLPKEVRGIYWTAYTAGAKRGDELMSYMQQTGLNTVVIDLKMDNGELAFIPNDASLESYTQKKPAIQDLDALLKKLGDQNIYRIARIAVMRDGMFARANPDIALRTRNGNFWKDNIGSVWVDPTSEKVSDYAIALGREAYTRGFDEVQYDYVRFASDGSISSIVYPLYKNDGTKVAVMQKFFQSVGTALADDLIPLSFDLFGMTLWSDDDFNIGQRLADSFPYSNFISPMVYPSHYPNGFQTFANPAEHPYEIVKQSLDKGVEQMMPTWTSDESDLRSHFRPWLQDFDIGAVYTAAKIEAQIKATRDAGAGGWILWNARNVYEPSNYK